MWNPLFRRTCSKAPLRVCSGFFVKKRMSGERSSSMVTMSEREGLFVPAFCALNMRNVRIVDVGGTSVGGSSGSVVTSSPCEMVRVSMCIVPAEEEASIGYMPCRVDFPEDVGGCPSVEDTSSSSGCGESGWE